MFASMESVPELWEKNQPENRDHGKTADLGRNDYEIQTCQHPG